MALTSPHARILSELKDRLSGLKDFRLIDEYHSQSIDDIPQLAYPALLVDIEDCNYEEAGVGSQFVTAEISIRVLQANYSQSSQKAPQKAKERAASVYELEAQVVAHIHGWAPTVEIDKEDHQFTAPFIRMSSRKDDDDRKGLRCRMLIFSTAWEEAFSARSVVKPAIAIDGKIIP